MRSMGVLCRLLPLLIAAPLSAQSPPAEPPVDSLRLWAARDSLDSRAYFDLGMGLWSRHRYDEADTAFQRALTLSPHYAEPHLALALLPFGRGERYLNDLSHRVSADSIHGLLQNSSRLYREAYLLDPLVDPRILRYLGVDELVPRYGEVEFQGGIVLSTAVPWWEGKTKRGVRYLVDGQYDSSFTVLDQVLHAREMSQGAALPDIFIWYYGLTAAHVAKYDLAADAFQELARRAFRRQNADPDWVLPTSRADYLYLYAVMSARYGNLGLAIPAFQETLAANFGLFEAHSRLADIQEDRGDVDGAITERRRAVDVSPETGELHLDLGVTLLGAGRAAAAESAFVDAARLLPNDPGAQQFLANTALQLGDSAVARRALERFVAVAPARYAEQVAQARRTLAGLP